MQINNFYRYVIFCHAPLQVNGKFYTSKTTISLRTFNVLKETEKGYWIGHFLNFMPGIPLREQGLWVSKAAKKRYAYPTKKEALANFIKRNERRLEILKNQIAQCKEALDIARTMDI
jgi:hypothetical protein